MNKESRIYEAPKITNLTGICEGKILAISQRETELKQYGNDDGCHGYKKKGCFDCDGFNTDCSTYLPATKKLIELYLNRNKLKPVDTRSPEEIMLAELQEKANRKKQ